MATIRVTHRPNLSVILSPTGLEPYADKKARIAELLDRGEQEERQRSVGH